MSSKLKRLVSSKVPSTYGGTTLIGYLCSRYNYQSRESWQQLIQNGDLKVNGQLETVDFLLKSNDVIEYDFTPSEEPEVDTNYKIVYEDDFLMVLDKPGDLPMHPAGKYFNHTLWALLKQKMETFHLINRLDRETSGLVLVAKNAETASKLAEQFEKGEVEKEYLTIVEGIFDEEIEGKGYLVKDAESPVRKKLRFVEAKDYEAYGKDGVRSDFKCLNKDDRFSLLKARIYTGKTHQIRATLCSLGYPVVGDKIYGIDDSLFVKMIEKVLTEEDRARLILKRQALHAYKLIFSHPEKNEMMSFELDLPDDMKGVLSCLT